MLRELLRLAMTDIGQALNADGTLKPIHEIPEDVRRAISGFEVEELDGDEGPTGRVRKVKFWDKKGSLDSLMRHLGLFKDKVEHGLDESFAELLKAARERARRG